MYKIKRIGIYVRVFVLMLLAKAASLFLRNRPEYRDLWIVSERGIDARDNGYHFFKYLCTAHPEVNAVYIIANTSPDYQKVAALGKTVPYGSFRHFLCFVTAKVKVSTHIDGYSPDILFFHKFRKLFPDHAKKIFLQHGIIKDDLAFCHADQTDIDMFVCSAVPEFEYVSETFGYPEGVLQLTGLCRYDNLKKPEQPTKRLLFMPTWRSALRTCTKQTFEASDYYRKYDAFLNSPALGELLAQFGYELVFYPHYEVQRFLDCFHNTLPAVKIADFQTSDVQQLLIGSDVLITDYSSVFFDYAYMRKPVVYYQYDEETFRREHYKEGYFDFRRDGFGEVVENEDALIAAVRRILENGLQPEQTYLDRMNGFFCFSDQNNSQRNYEAILRLL